MKCDCEKCLILILENHISNLKECRFCGHYCIDRVDGKNSCDCKDSVKRVNEDKKIEVILNKRQEKLKDECRVKYKKGCMVCPLGDYISSEFYDGELNDASCTLCY